MMICPLTYINENIKDKSSQEIKKEIDKLKRRIRELKRELENPCVEKRTILSPSPKTQISVLLEYIKEARAYLFEKTGELYMTKTDERAEAFENNLSKIEKITLTFHSFFMPSDPITVTIKGENAILKNIIEEKMLDKESFLLELKRLNIGTWRRHYDTLRFDYAVLDGTQWLLEIKYLDGKKTTYSGSNAYPYNFDDLCDLLEYDRE